MPRIMEKYLPKFMEKYLPVTRMQHSKLVPLQINIEVEKAY